MVEEDQNQVCSDISNNVGCVGMNRSSTLSTKKLKHKKMPQRGLGVAQLEKIRIEEQETKDTTNTTNTNISSTSTTLSPTLITPLTINSTPFPNYQHNNNKNSKSLDIFTPSNLPSPNAIFRSCSFADIDTFNIGSIPSLNSGWSPMPTNGNVNVNNVSFPMPTNNGNMNVNFPFLGHAYEFSHGSVSENSRLDHHGFMFRSNLSLPYESCPIAPLPDLIPRLQQYHQPCNSLVNSSSMNHSSSSTISFRMEPPSSQSYCSNYSPLWPDEEKIMVGMKRPCPFPLDNPPIPPYYGKYPTLPSHSTSPSERSTTYDNGGTSSNFDPTIPIFREVPSCHSAMFELPSSNKFNKSDNGNCSNEDFITMASPTITPPFPTPTLKQSSTFYKEFLNFECLPYRGSFEDILVDSRQGGPKQEPNSFFNFFPSTKMQVASASSSTGRNNSQNSEVGESIDLNLRL